MTTQPPKTAGNAPKRVVMFCRKYNDVDHMAPIAYALAKQGHQVDLLSLSPLLDIESDYRTVYVRDTVGVRLGHVYRDYSSSIASKLVARLLSPKYAMCSASVFASSFSSWIRGHGAGRGTSKVSRNPLDLLMWVAARYFQRFLYQRVKGRVLDKYVFNHKWANGLLRAVGADVAVFDWVKPYQWSAGCLVEAARDLGIPTVSVPHGIHLLTDRLYTHTQIERGYPVRFDRSFGQFDAFVVQFQRYAQTATENGLQQDKVHTLGSARYCREWHEIYERISPKAKFPPAVMDAPGLKVVFMDYADGYRINTKNVRDGLQAIDRIPGITLVIKPATRSDRLGSTEFPSNVILATHIPSIALCEWADVVIGTTSSILIEPLLKNKVLVYPKYFHENTMLFEEMKACWTVGSTEELVQAITRLKADPNERDYSAADVGKFLQYVVEGGQKDRDVLGDYVQLITNQEIAVDEVAVG